METANFQPAQAPSTYSTLPVSHVHAGRQGLYQSLPASPHSQAGALSAISPMNSQLSPTQIVSDQHAYPTLESLDASGEVHEVAPPSIEVITEAARVAERHQMEKRAQPTSLDATSSPAYTFGSPNIVHRSSSTPLESSSGDKTAIGKMAATLGSKFTDITRLSLSMYPIVSLIVNEMLMGIPQIWRKTRFRPSASSSLLTIPDQLLCLLSLAMTNLYFGFLNLESPVRPVQYVCPPRLRY